MLWGLVEPRGPSSARSAGTLSAASINSWGIFVREYGFLYLHYYPVPFTCPMIDDAIDAVQRGANGKVLGLLEALRKENAALRHNAATWEVEAKAARPLVDAAPDSPEKDTALRLRARRAS